MQAKCTNFGNCTKADNNEIIDLPAGADLVCPICSRPLTPVNTGGGARTPIVPILISLLLLIGAGFLAKNFFGPKAPPPISSIDISSRRSNSNPSGDFATTTPNPSATVPTNGTTDISYYYERSAEGWLKQAASDFEKTHPQFHMVGEPKASRDGKQDILYEHGHPSLWIPVDMYWPEKLNRDWRDSKVGNHSSDIVVSKDVILRTRFVLVTRADRAQILQAAMNQPQYKGKTWTLLYDLATRGWSAIGGQSGWGKLHLAQTDPTKSNSGQTALALMFYEFKNSHSDAAPNSGEFLKFMRGIEGAVNSFSETTSKALDSFLQPGSQSDVALVYEVNAISGRSQRRRGHSRSVS